MRHLPHIIAIPLFSLSGVADVATTGGTDKHRLLEARDAITALPKPVAFHAVDRDGNRIGIEWPPSIRVVNGFVRCFNETYAEAYNQCSDPELNAAEQQAR